MVATVKDVHWDGGVQQHAAKILIEGGRIVVSPTKVGYVILATDEEGLEQKFSAKNRNRNKPGVVLISSLDELEELAELNSEAKELYRRHWEEDILLGTILPWKQSAKDKFLSEHKQSLVSDKRGTSCFVIKYGTPSEQLSTSLWEDHGKLVFASSANPSGQGNRGLVTGIGDRIREHAALVIEADDYVASNQPGKDEHTRYEQGVMVSLVDTQGRLVPEQHGERSVTPAPVLIRKGLAVDKIMVHLAEIYNSWDYRHGKYY